MSVYHFKLLELVSIEKISDISYLKIKLLLEKEVELYWKIDRETADQMKSVIKFDGVCKYRLSFISSWDPMRSEHRCYITKTYKDLSEKICFPCTESFVQELEEVKGIQGINHINSLSFLSEVLFDGEKKIDEQEKDRAFTQVCKNETSKISSLVKKVTVIAAAIFVFSSVYIGYDYFNKTAFGEEMHVNRDAIQKNIGLIHKGEFYVNRDLAVETSEKNHIPEVELEDLVSFHISDGKVALTFDDGPSPYTEKITDILTDYGVGGTFFFVGNNVKKYSEEVLYVQNHGLEIGSHSMTHRYMPILSDEDLEIELLKTNKLIENITGVRVGLFRPTFGAYDDRIIDLLSEHHLKMVHWNVDPEDWKANRSEEIVDHVRHADISGSIILLHETEAVVEALPEIIEYLLEKDLQLVNLR